MKSFCNLVFVALAAMFLISCASTPLPPPVFSYGRDAITIDISADPRLNLNGGSAHTLLLCVHQLRDPNAFNRLSSTEKGIYQLLECSQFDPGVTNSKRIIVQPGQQALHTLDRAEGSKYVAFVGGYYDARKEDVVGLFEIPVVKRTTGIVRRTKFKEPGRLDITLELGPQRIRSSVAQK